MERPDERRTVRNVLMALAVGVLAVALWLRMQPDAPPPVAVAPLPQPVASPTSVPAVVIPSAAPATSGSEAAWTPEKKHAAAAEAEVAALEAEEQKLSGVNFEAPRPVLDASLPNVIPKRESEVTPQEKLAQTEALSTALKARAVRIRAELAAAKTKGEPANPAREVIARRLEARAATLDVTATKLRAELGMPPPDGGVGVAPQ